MKKHEKHAVFFIALLLCIIFIGIESTLSVEEIVYSEEDLKLIVRDKTKDVVRERSATPVKGWRQIDLVECSTVHTIRKDQKYLKVRVTTDKKIVWGRKFSREVEFYEFVVIIKPKDYGPHQSTQVLRVIKLGPQANILIQNTDGRTIESNPELLLNEWKDNYFELYIPIYLLEKYYLLPEFKLRVESRVKLKEKYMKKYGGERYLADFLLSHPRKSDE